MPPSKEDIKNYLKKQRNNNQSPSLQDRALAIREQQLRHVLSRVSGPMTAEQEEKLRAEFPDLSPEFKDAAFKRAQETPEAKKEREGGANKTPQTREEWIEDRKARAERWLEETRERREQDRSQDHDHGWDFER